MRRGELTKAIVLGFAVAVVSGCAGGGEEVADLFTAKSESSTPRSAFVGVTVIDGTGAPPRRDAVVVIDGDQIISVEDAKRWVRSPEVRVVDAAGLFVIPGLWDMHVHLSAIRPSALALFPAVGVTSVRDMGGDFEEVKLWRREIRAGNREGPRIWSCGPMLESPANEERARSKYKLEDRSRTRIAVGTVAEAKSAVQRVASMGVDFVKMRTYHSQETYFAIAAAAAEHRLPFVGHAPWELDPEVAVNAGQRSFEHGFYPWPLDDLSAEERQELFALYARSQVALVPTLVAWESRTVPVGDIEAIADDSAGELEPRRPYLARRHVEKWREEIKSRRDEGPLDHKAWRRVLDTHADVMGQMHRAGVLVLPGSDVAGLLLYPGFSLHDELRLFVEKGGMSPAQALESATRQSAEFMGQGDRLGTIEPGKLADFVLLGADPLVDIRNVSEITRS